MCGIAGVWTTERERGRQAVLAMNRAQAHRGPDDAGVETCALPAGFLTLGHRRLSIIDLSSAGHQPMQHPGTGDWITYNGEIYNFPELRTELAALGAEFRTKCDTEVILHAYARWGTECFTRLRGMFALAIYDRQRGRLVLACDHFGIKPLYYTSARGTFAFASELRALDPAGLTTREVDRRALAGLLAYGAVPAPLTLRPGVDYLPAATWAAFSLAGDAAFSTACYWRFCKNTAGTRAQRRGPGSARGAGRRRPLAFA